MSIESPIGDSLIKFGPGSRQAPGATTANIDPMRDIVARNIEDLREAPASKDPKCKTATDLLRRSIEIQDERALDYDQPDGERSMGKVVQAFNAIKGREVLAESDGWLIQVLLKVVRDQSRQHAHRDSCEDLVSYGSLYSEARLSGR